MWAKYWYSPAQLTVIAHSGIAPERWSISLQVMLEKIAGVFLVEKLWAIQLYEVDYNFFQQFIFGEEAIKLLVDGGFLPEEHFSQKGSTAEDAKFEKTLMTDLSCQARHPLVIVYVDAALCCDWVNHIIMSLVWLLLIQHIGTIAVVLCCLQTMSFFQCTCYGDGSSSSCSHGWCDPWPLSKSFSSLASHYFSSILVLYIVPGEDPVEQISSLEKMMTTRTKFLMLLIAT